MPEWESSDRGGLTSSSAQNQNSPQILFTPSVCQADTHEHHRLYRTTKLFEFNAKVVSFTKHLQEGQKLYLNVESSSGL